MGKLPPEIGRVVEQLIGKATEKADGDWIADYAEFEDTVFSGIKVSRLHMTDAGLHIRQNGEILDAATIGIPVIAVGVPTSIRAGQLGIKIPCDDLLTPAGITNIIKYAASAIACAVLQVAYPGMDYETSKMFVDELMLY